MQTCVKPVKPRVHLAYLSVVHRLWLLHLDCGFKEFAAGLQTGQQTALPVFGCCGTFLLQVPVFLLQLQLLPG